MTPRSRLLVTVAAATTCATSLALWQPSLATGAAPPPSPRSQSAPSSDSHGSVDLRRGTTAADASARDRVSTVLKAKPAVRSLSQSLGPQAVIDMDPATGTPRDVSRLDGTLTAPSGATPRSVALGFVSAHLDAFGLTDVDVTGLTLSRDYVDVEGIHHLSFTQSAGGVTLFGNGLKANVTKDGRLINVTGSPVHALTAPAAVASPITPAAAVQAAKKGAGEPVVTRGSKDTATPVLFATAGGVRRATQTVTMSGEKPALSVVDDATGRILYRSYLSADFAGDSPVPPAAQPAAAAGGTAAKPAGSGALKATVYDYFPQAAGAGGKPHDVNLTSKGWLPAGSTTLSGNNVHTYADINDNNAADPTEEVAPAARTTYQFPLVRMHPAGEPCDAFVCTWDPAAPFSWTKNLARSSAQNFYFINTWHDYLARPPIGFTESAGNFQLANATGQGLGGDPVLDENLDGANTAAGLPDLNHIDNANFATPPDGQSPTMQMYLWHAPTIPNDPFVATMGSDEADIVYHEYTHGLSHRLVVDASNNPALDSVQGGSMGEAWSDWYALDYLVNQGLVKDTKTSGDVQLATYVGAGQTFRSEGTDCTVGSTAALCPGTDGTQAGGYTYGDFGRIFDATGDVHAAGEIWAQTLWDVRGALGAQRAESLVTRAMEISPTFPSYLDMRNSILAADSAVYAGKDRSTLWKLFAARGMGFFAASTSGEDTHPVEDFSVPPTTTQRGSLTGTVKDSQSGSGVAGVTVAFGGHASGLPGDYAATTNASGAYSITGIIPGTYVDVVAGGAGYNPDVATVSIGRGTNTEDWQLVRDWAASSGGATITDFNGPDYTSFGCGPVGDIDQSLGTGWGSDSAGGTKFIVIKLPAAVDVSQLAVDPSNTCGDGPEAATAGYQVETSPDGTTWTVASAGTFGPSNLGTLNPLTPTAGATGVQYIRFDMLGPQGGPTTQFLDSSEVQVYGSPAA